MPVKNTPIKKSKVKKVEEVNEEEEVEKEEMPVISKKAKAPVDLEFNEPIGLAEEKLEDDPILGEETEEIGIDDSGLDEEIDPFGDKWEA